MYKNIISALLTLVMVFSMTACSVSDTPSATSEPTTAAASTTTVEQSAEVSIPTEEDSSVGHIGIHDPLVMSPEDFSAALDELVQISAINDLSLEDMNALADGFRAVYNYHGNYTSTSLNDLNVEEYETKATEAFSNIHSNALNQQIPLNKLQPWSHIPVADVMVKYFSSTNFSTPVNANCAFIYELEEDDALRVAEAACNNPLLSTNYGVARDLITYRHSDKVNALGRQHLINLSLTTDSEVSEYTADICDGIFSYFRGDSPFLTEEVCQLLHEVQINILENPVYDFTDKYTYFLLSSSVEDEYDLIATEKLMELARNADSEAASLIKSTADAMYDIGSDYYVNKAAELLEALES